MVVYKITNLLNNKIYVGIDIKNDSTYLGSSVHIKHIIKEYGTKNFKKEILEECKTEEELRDREIYWIKKLNSSDPDVGYNVIKTRRSNDNVDQRLTSVVVDKHLFTQFKIKSIQTGISLKQLLSTTLHDFVSSSFSGSIGV